MSTAIRVSLLAFVLTAPVWARNLIGPDAAGYTATDDTSYSFVNIASTGVRTLALTDDGTSEASIGFPFALYGVSYTDACISANGYLLFGGCTDEFLNQDLTGARPPGNLPIVAPLWSDLTFLWPTADAVYYETLGTAPARQFVVQWNRAFPQNAPQPVTLQVILYEGSNTIRFQYQSLDAGATTAATDGGTATVGVCDAGGAASGRCLQWSYNAAVLRSDLAILIDPNTAPPVLPLPGRMHGSGFVLQNGVKHDFEFDVREDAPSSAEATFRVTVHRQGKPLRFTARTLTSVIFSDDPNAQPGGPQGLLADLVIFNGTGDWNGSPDHTYEVSARDEGEPGRHRESIRFTIMSPTGVVVAHADGELGGGNLQSTRVKH